MNKNWYQLDQNEIFKLLNSSDDGLTNIEVKKRLSKHGLNELAEGKKQNLFLSFLSQFASPLIYILLIVMLVTLILQKYVDTFVIFLIVIVNAVIGFYQELKAENSLEALKKIVPLKTKVLRDKEEDIIDSKYLVPGDIIIFEQGDKISADIRILESLDLKIDESIITGESVPANKNSNTIKKETNIIERENIAYAGSIISSGKGYGIVVETQNNTEIGKIAKEISLIKKEITPLHRNLNNFAQYLLIVTILICLLFFIIGIVKHEDPIQMFLFAASAAVSLIPEGLPAIITIALALGVSKMAKNNAIVRELSSVETLGTISAIASDKTGTITYNQMTMEKIIFSDDEVINITGKGYEPKGIFSKDFLKINPNPNSNLGKLLTISVLCNNSSLINKNKKWEIYGDPTEGSLLVAASKADLHKKILNEKYPRLSEIPFSSQNKYMATLNTFKQKNIICVKGMLEKIINSSTSYNHNGKIVNFSSVYKKNILSLANEESLKAMRILGFAYKEVDKNIKKISDHDIKDLTYLGFCDLSDPPRPEVREAIEKCRAGGIRPIMITGDFEGTALAVAKNIGMINSNYHQVISEEKLLSMTKAEFRDAIRDNSIFARITPEMKYKIVNELQAQKQIVAVTGDGVNDAPVLEKANVGIAMGIGGTDVARDASEIILLDNKFSTIISAIEEGRTIFLNIRRSIFYLLSTNFGEVIILIFALALGWNIPLLPLQILWINFITDSFAGISLTFEPKKTEVINNPPRKIKEGILTKQNYHRIVLVAIVMAVGTLFLYISSINSGNSLEKSRSIAFAVMGIFQIFNMLNARSMSTSIFKLNFFSNKYIIYSFVLMSILTILTIESPIFQKIFSTTGLSIIEWISIFTVSASVIIAVELDKYLRKLLKS